MSSPSFAEYPIEQWERSVYRDSLHEYVKAAWSEIESAPFIDNWHISAICEHLQAVTKGQIKNLLINIPPGCSKSLLTCVFWPTWEWTLNPAIRWFFASYDQQLSTRDSVKCRSLVTGSWFNNLWPGRVRLVGFQNQKTYYETTKGGYRLATSVGGHGTGEHPDRIVVDDPHSVKKAESEAERQAVLEWWDLTMPTRGVSRNARRVIIMQRLHHRDLSAHVFATGNYVHLCLPMRYEQGRMKNTSLGWNDPRTVEGELLTPRQFDEEKLAVVEKSLGVYGVAGQQQQRPTPRGGGLFKQWWFNKRVRSAPRDSLRVRYWDRAACLIAGTMVETSNGPVPIEQVRAGDYVLTRKGYREVRWSGMSGVVTELTSVRFANGSVLTGTPDHPVWDDGSGKWIDMAMLDGGCYNVCLPTDWRQTCKTRESVSGKSLRARKSCGSMDDHTPENREQGIFGEAGNSCTGLSGSTITVTSPTAVKFITRMMIGTTTQSKILNVSLRGNTTERMGCLGSGTRRKHPRSITSGLQECGSKPQRTRTTSASNVEEHSNLGIWMGSEFVSVGLYVPTDSVLERKRPVNGVGSSIGIDPDLTHARKNVLLNCSSEFVRCAERSLMVGRREKPSYAVAKSADASRGVPVYDLQVDGVHEFFANGVLVHNTQDGGCYTAGVLMAKDKDGIYHVEDVIHGQWEPNERNRRIVATAHKDRVRYGPTNEPIIYIEAERGSTGLEAFQRLASQLSGFRVKEDMPTGAKDVRAEPWSDQLAAGNVCLVDGGESEGSGKAEWDVLGYVEEHCQFKPEPGKRLGKYKDMVDSSSGAFNLLAQMIPMMEFRALSFRTDAKKKNVSFVLASKEALSALTVEEKSLLVVLDNPDTDSTDLPPHALTALQGSTVLRFADINPPEVQDRWTEVFSPYDKTPEHLIFSREQARKLWALVLKHRDPPVRVIVICDNGGTDRRAESVVKALTDVMGVPRKEIYYVDNSYTDDKVKELPPTNPYIFDMMKAMRGAMMG